MGNDLTIRNVTKNDSELLFNWRNEDSVRIFSRNSHLLTWEEHEKWFNKIINSNTGESLIYIFEKSGKKIGMTRIDKAVGDSSEISIILDPKFRGKGLSKQLLSTTLDIIAKDFTYERIIATVHQDNIASQRAFKALGFRVLRQNQLFITYQWFPRPESNTSTV